MKLFKSILVLPTCFLVLGCGGESGEAKRKMEGLDLGIPESAWEKMKGASYYFGHHSVGNNMLDGIRDLLAENNVTSMEILETTDPGDIRPGVFAHSKVGANKDPKSKIDGFESVLAGGLAEKVDKAFFKFCYVDIEQGSDVEKVFQDYKFRVESFREKYPDLEIIHMTVPIKTLKPRPSIKESIKKLLGRQKFDYENNIMRNKFNDLIVAEYGADSLFFDLAKYESTYPNGERSYFERDGKKYYTLVPEYTDDGGHLNELGRKVIAKELVTFLTR